jgi:hypothetical protein
MRIGIVVENHQDAIMGGAQYQAHLLALELSRRPGVSVTYFARGAPSELAQARLPYACRKIGHRSGIRRRAVIFDAPQLWRALAELRPDAIYQRMKQSYTGVCAGYARRAGIPFIFQVAHDEDLDSRLVRRRWLSKNLPFDVAEAAAGSWGVRRADHIIAQTERQVRLLHAGFGRAECTLVRNFQPLPDNLPVKPTGPMRVVWIANLKEFKRPELFLRLARVFAGRTDLEFIMAGQPANHWRLRPLIAEMRSTRNLRYLEEQPLEAVNALLEQSHVFVNTSRAEGFPNTFIQAWGRGAVVASIAVDVDGGMDAQGIGYCTRDFEGLCAVIDRLSRSETERENVAARAFQYVRREHSLDNAARLADLIIGSARPASIVGAQAPWRTSGG